MIRFHPLILVLIIFVCLCIGMPMWGQDAPPSTPVAAPVAPVPTPAPTVPAPEGKREEDDPYAMVDPAFLDEAKKLAKETKELDLAIEVLTHRRNARRAQMPKDPIQSLIEEIDEQLAQMPVEARDPFQRAREHLVQAKGVLDSAYLPIPTYGETREQARETARLKAWKAQAKAKQQADDEAAKKARLKQAT